MTWLLLRGLFREQRHWGDFPDMLRELYRDQTIMTMDIPGSGMRNQEKSPARIQGMVDHIRQDLRDKNITYPIKLLGISMGGMMVCDWIMSYPNEVDGAVIINSSLKGYSPTTKRLKFENLASLARVLASSNHEKENYILEKVSNRLQLKSATASKWRELSKQNPISKINGARQLLAAARFQPPKIQPQVATLILNSEGDRLVDPSCSEDIARTWKAPIYSHPHAGHDLVLDDPKWVIEKIKNWDQLS